MQLVKFHTYLCIYTCEHVNGKAWGKREKEHQDSGQSGPVDARARVREDRRTSALVLPPAVFVSHSLLFSRLVVVVRDLGVNIRSEMSPLIRPRCAVHAGLEQISNTANITSSADSEDNWCRAEAKRIA